MPTFPSLSQLRWSRARAHSRLYCGLALNVIWMLGLSFLFGLFKDGVVSATSNGTDTRIPNVEFNTMLFYPLAIVFVLLTMGGTYFMRTSVLKVHVARSTIAVVGFHTLDLITDVGFFFEALNSKEFEQQYESAYQVQVVCIASLVLSLLVWFVRTFAMEFLGVGATGFKPMAFYEAETAEARAKEVRKHRYLAFFGLAIEDAPMLVCQCIYISAMGFRADADSALVIVSPLITAASLFYFLLLRLPDAVGDKQWLELSGASKGFVNGHYKRNGEECSKPQYRKVDPVTAKPMLKDGKEIKIFFGDTAAAGWGTWRLAHQQGGSLVSFYKHTDKAAQFPPTDGWVILKEARTNKDKGDYQAPTLRYL